MKLKELTKKAQEIISLNGNSGATASFVGLREDGAIDRAAYTGTCHEPFNTMTESAVVGHFLRKKKTIEKEKNPEAFEIYKSYLTWLANDSGYSDCFLTKDFDDFYENNMVVNSGQYPAGLVKGALIAIRVVEEYDVMGRGKVWYDLFKQGVDGNLALLISAIANYSASVGVTPNEVHGHYPVTSVSNKDLAIIGNMINKRYDESVKPINQGGSARAVTDAWLPENRKKTGISFGDVINFNKGSIFNEERVDKGKLKSLNPWSDEAVEGMKMLKSFNTDMLKEIQQKYGA
jgi:hypothetical protein